jgi:hypothetical protein
MQARQLSAQDVVRRSDGGDRNGESIGKPRGKRSVVTVEAHVWSPDFWIGNSSSRGKTVFS